MVWSSHTHSGWRDARLRLVEFMEPPIKLISGGSRCDRERWSARSCSTPRSSRPDRTASSSSRYEQLMAWPGRCQIPRRLAIERGFRSERRCSRWGPSSRHERRTCRRFAPGCPTVTFLSNDQYAERYVRKEVGGNLPSSSFKAARHDMNFWYPPSCDGWSQRRWRCCSATLCVRLRSVVK